MQGDFKMKKILFQGDSITEFYRNFEDRKSMGKGYALFVEAELGFQYPGEYEFVNRGVGGNNVRDLYSRIVIDIINEKPDYISILVGVNDIWHKDWNNETGAKRFRKIYDTLLSEIEEELPETKIMLFGPYVLLGEATRNSENDPNRWERFNNGVRENAQIVKELAEKHNLKYTPLQPVFDEAFKKTGYDYLTTDGVHPTPVGSELITREWLKAFNEIK